MILTSWRRLVSLYETRIGALLSGKVTWEELAESAVFRRAALRAAQDMVSGVARVNERTWRAAAMKSMRSRDIFEALEEEVARKGFSRTVNAIANRNARLICSVPAEVAKATTNRAAELQRQGARATEIERELRAQAKRITTWRISLIARTEVSRAEADLTRYRAESIGVEFYQWETADDSRVRDSHENLNHVLVAWQDPPQPEKLIHQKSTLGPGHAGQFPNCRCFGAPLVSLDEVKWPARVHRNGRIVRMTRPEFQRWSGAKIAA